MRTHARARRLILKVTEHGQARLTVPPRTPQSQIEAFLAQHRRWLDSTVRAALSQHPEPTANVPPESLDLIAVAERWQLQFVERAGQAGVRSRLRPSTAPDLHTLRVTYDPERIESQQKLRSIVRRALIDRAKTFYNLEMEPLAREMGVAFTRLQVRNQRSVWGSCSSSGTISLNLAGLFLRPELARYLCIHELAHRRHMNHSAAFWALVESVEPAAKSLDTQLGGTHAVLPRWLW